jgi:hypothetical protein
MNLNNDIIVSICFSYMLMRKCWQYQPNERPTFEQIVGELESLKEKFPSID